MGARNDHGVRARRARAGLVIAMICTLVSTGIVFAQELPIQTSPGPSKQATRPEPRRLPDTGSSLPEASAYPRDVGVRHAPAFIEPLVARHETKAGPGRFGLSGWTAPNVPVVGAQSGASEVNGWFSLGFSLTWGDLH
jgi:hypothetical protein